eukprot:1007285-Pyramimonas_sp.AAC.1
MGPRRAARGPRRATAELRRACVWLPGSPKRERDSPVNCEEVSGGSRDPVVNCKEVPSESAILQYIVRKYQAGAV